MEMHSTNLLPEELPETLEEFLLFLKEFLLINDNMRQ